MARANPKQQATAGGKGFLSQIDWRWWFNSFLLVGVITVLAWGWQRIHDPHRFPIHQVMVNSTFHHITKQDLESSLEPLVTGNFFTINEQAITQKLLQMPWVANVEVRKIWPDKLVIKVVEQKPVAIWDQHSLLNAHGDIFTPTGFLPQDLPRLTGPVQNQMLVLKSYREINELLTPLHLNVVELDLSARMSWHMVLDNRMDVTIGSIDPLMRLKRFVKVYPEIFRAQSANVASVDLRYNNGLAVQWVQKTDDKGQKTNPATKNVVLD